jgi:AcrR family transcriptional regulator
MTKAVEATETRGRLLAAAERLFARHGFEATSVRDITSEADCNVAAVNYHFGGKEKLYVETFRGLLGELRDRRIQRIRRDMEEAGEAATLETFVESFAVAFLEPLVDEARGRVLMAFLAREMDRNLLPHEVFFGEFIRPMLEVTMEALRRVGPPMDPVTARLCMLSLVGQLLHVIRVHQMQEQFRDAAGSELVPNDLRRHVEHVVTFSAGGIHACALESERDLPPSTSGSHDHANHD